jgi:hypothetical protein
MNENLGGKGGDFWDGITAPFVASIPAAGSGAPVSLCRGRPERPIGRPRPSPWLLPSHRHQLLQSLSLMAEDGSKDCEKKIIVR